MSDNKPRRALIGQMVIWKPSRNAAHDDCCPAVVTTSGSAVALSLMGANQKMFTLKESVRHETDPMIDRQTDNRDGVWVTIEEHWFAIEQLRSQIEADAEKRKAAV